MKNDYFLCRILVIFSMDPDKKLDQIGRKRESDTHKSGMVQFRIADSGATSAGAGEPSRSGAHQCRVSHDAARFGGGSADSAITCLQAPRGHSMQASIRLFITRGVNTVQSIHSWITTHFKSNVKQIT